MKEENKYYTPEIEEFCVGFEYEFRVYRTEVWRKFQFLIDDEFDCLYDFEEELSRCRVKYLDSEDIVDLGFTFKKSNKYFNSEVFTKQRELGINQFEVCQITLFKDYPIQILLEYNTHTGYEEQSIYKYLKIKNKSKLKEVLQMICVL